MAAATTAGVSDQQWYQKASQVAEEFEKVLKSVPSLSLSWACTNPQKNVFTIKVDAKDPRTNEWVTVFTQDEIGPTNERVYDIFQRAKVRVNQFYQTNGQLPAPGSVTIPVSTQ